MYLVRRVLVASLGSAILLMHTTVPWLVLGNRMPRVYRQNDTIALSVSLPTSGESESKQPSRGLLWQDLSVITPNKECLVRSSSGYLENGQVCGILGPCKQRIKIVLCSAVYVYGTCTKSNLQSRFSLLCFLLVSLL
jgi:hypothetical protein